MSDENSNHQNQVFVGGEGTYRVVDEAGPEHATVQSFAIKLGITEACAYDVLYLRTRHRWTQELEDQLIALHKAGTPPESIYEYGVTEQTQKALMDRVIEMMAQRNIKTPEIINPVYGGKQIDYFFALAPADSAKDMILTVNVSKKRPSDGSVVFKFNPDHGFVLDDQ